ncbi:zeta toxin family protein [Arabiibacter massiliensis]|uniref:zeta toxin family protein n=1 Tax=Arabiibacter massiliensis TaxID=1870985 RepID=UPI0009BAB8B9|nr:zeta toxin family protein [Arabiibacter massiliensis]
MMKDDPGAFSEEEFVREFQSITKRLVLESRCAPSAHPQAVLLGGQSGAGKTALHELCVKGFKGGGIVINGDEYRSRHPRFAELDARYGPEAVAHTAAWAGQMVEALVKSLSTIRYNLVVEGTLRTSQVPLQTAALLRGKGYRVSLALMAVKPEISLLSCQLRYELMRLAGTTPRATDPAHHNKIVADIVENLGVLEASGLFDEIRLYSREKELLFPVEGEGRAAAEALADVLFGPWTSEELEHRAFLQAKLDALRPPTPSSER